MFPLPRLHHRIFGVLKVFQTTDMNSNTLSSGNDTVLGCRGTAGETKLGVHVFNNWDQYLGYGQLSPSAS